MATVIGNNQVKLDNGQTVTAQTGGWYDGMQFWNGSLSQPGQIHTESNQPGAGGTVSNEVIAQTNPNNVAYIAEQRAKQGLTPAPATGVPSSTPSTPSTPSQSGFSSGSVTGLNEAFSATPSINLPDIYKNLYASSGITDKEADLTNKEKQFLEAKNKISDNPFLSASMLDQRLQRLQGKYDAETAPLKSEIAMKKADIETQLNLQTKQFDINSEQAKNSLAYFNTLLSAGALDGASGEDIAGLTRATGLSSSIIQSAINTSKASKVKTQVITSTNDAGVVTVSVIDPNTGKTINQTSLGAIGNAQNGTGTASTTKNTEQTFINDANTIQGQQTPSGWVGQFPILVAKYAPYYSLEQIYSLYLKSDVGKKYGTPKEDATQIKEVYDQYRGY